MITKAAEFSTGLNQLANLAKALSHPARIQILKTVAKRKECFCGEIVEVLPLAQSTVSQHLRELKAAGLIKGETEGLRACYCIDWKAVRKFRDLSAKFFLELERHEQAGQCC